MSNDIAMCVGGDCPMKKDCYRYRAIPHVRQMFFTIPPREGRECKYFWQLEKEHKIRCMEEIKEHGENLNENILPSQS